MSTAYLKNKSKELPLTAFSLLSFFWGGVVVGGREGWWGGGGCRGRGHFAANLINTLNSDDRRPALH